MFFGAVDLYHLGPRKPPSCWALRFPGKESHVSVGKSGHTEDQLGRMNRMNSRNGVSGRKKAPWFLGTRRKKVFLVQLGSWELF